MDASNLLKPMLGRGELRCIGATTLDEYRKYIEKDPALERRFQQVQQQLESSSIALLWKRASIPLSLHCPPSLKRTTPWPLPRLPLQVIHMSVCDEVIEFGKGSALGHANLIYSL